MSETDIQLRRIADALEGIATQLESGANSEKLTFYDQVALIVDMIEDPLLHQCLKQRRQKRS
jgi:hypothetical protein